MELTSPSLLLRIVIKFLAVDLATTNTPFLFVSGTAVTDNIMSPGEISESGATQFQFAVSTKTDIDTLLSQLKSELAKDSSYAYCYEEENCTGEQYCNVGSHQCQCHEAAYVDGSCPSVGMMCTSCCCGRNVYCSGQFCEVYSTQGVSSQMILSIVMVMGVVSIVFMIYRMCYRNTLQQRLLLASAAHEDTSRPSLSSLQIGVMARMCDRPPGYERHYTQPQPRNVSTDTGSTTLGGVDNRGLEVCEAIEPRDMHRASSVDVPPPPYYSSRDEHDNRSISSTRSSVVGSALSSAPPPYYVAVKSPQLPTAENSTSDTQRTNSSVGNGNVLHKELYI